MTSPHFLYGSEATLGICVLLASLPYRKYERIMRLV